LLLLLFLCQQLEQLGKWLSVNDMRRSQHTTHNTQH
jgi:hypothetical protein